MGFGEKEISTRNLTPPPSILPTPSEALLPSDSKLSISLPYSALLVNELQGTFLRNRRFSVLASQVLSPTRHADPWSLLKSGARSAPDEGDASSCCSGSDCRTASVAPEAHWGRNTGLV